MSNPMTTAVDIGPAPALITAAEGIEIHPRVLEHILYRDRLIESLRLQLTARDELLRDIKGVFAGDAVPHWVNSMDTTLMRGHYLDRIDAILAKGETK